MVEHRGRAKSVLFQGATRHISKENGACTERGQGLMRLRLVCCGLPLGASTRKLEEGTTRPPVARTKAVFAPEPGGSVRSGSIAFKVMSAARLRRRVFIEDGPDARGCAPSNKLA